MQEGGGDHVVRYHKNTTHLPYPSGAWENTVVVLGGDWCKRSYVFVLPVPTPSPTVISCIPMRVVVIPGTLHNSMRKTCIGYLAQEKSCVVMSH